MHSLHKPNIEFLDLLTKCSILRDKILQANLTSKFCLINTAAKKYDSKASDNKLHEIKPISPQELTPITVENLKYLYTKKMVGGSSPGRHEYERILASSKQHKCCFCSYEEPTEIDHFLPKSSFPEFSILPINLVPSCHRCNKLKSRSSPTSWGESYVHPYYEEYSHLNWLEADLDFSTRGEQPTVIYSISKELKTSNHDLAEKLEFQFSKLELNERYSSHAASEISNITYVLQCLSNKSGVNVVRQHLLSEADSRKHFNSNSWQSALYSCLYKSEEFCEISWGL